MGVFGKAIFSYLGGVRKAEWKPNSDGKRVLLLGPRVLSHVIAGVSNGRRVK